MNQYDSQCTEIRKHLESGREISQREAIAEYGCYRLGARIYELRADGLDIETQRRTCKNRNGKTVNFAVYKLKGGAQCN